MANRRYGKDLSVFAVASAEVVALVQSCTIEYGPDTVDGTCLVDPVPTNRPNRDSFNISFEVAYDATSNELNTIQSAVGGLVGFHCVSAGLGSTDYACSEALLTKATHNIPDGGQSIRFEIVPHGTQLIVSP